MGDDYLTFNDTGGTSGAVRLTLDSGITIDAGTTVMFEVAPTQIGSTEHYNFPGLAREDATGSYDSYISLQNMAHTSAEVTEGSSVTLGIFSEDGAGAVYDSSTTGVTYTVGDRIWVGYVVEPSGGGATMYIDDTELATDVRTFTPWLMNYLACGYWGATDAGALIGDVYEIVVFDGALTAAEVSSWVNDGFYPSAPHLAHWTFSDGSGSTVADSVGSNDLTINGTEGVEYEWTVAAAASSDTVTASTPGPALAAATTDEAVVIDASLPVLFTPTAAVGASGTVTPTLPEDILGLTDPTPTIDSRAVVYVASPDTETASTPAPSIDAGGTAAAAATTDTITATTVTPDAIGPETSFLSPTADALTATSVVPWVGGALIPTWIGVRPAVNVGGFNGDPLNDRTYDDTITEADADYIASSATELTSALAAATSGDVVYIPETTTITVSTPADPSTPSFVVPAGVTLASNRGETVPPTPQDEGYDDMAYDAGSYGSASVGGVSLGGAIVRSGWFDYATNSGADHDTLIATAGNGARVTGLRIGGPWGATTDPRGGVCIRAAGTVEVDNCEVYGASTAVALNGVGASSVHHNYLYDVANPDRGIAVSLGGVSSGERSIYANYVDEYTTFIAGLNNETFEARDNILTANSYGPAIDMAGTGTLDGQAGNTLYAHHNTHLDADETFFVARGIPADLATVSYNWSYNSAAPTAVTSATVPDAVVAQTYDSLAPSFVHFAFLSNHWDTTEPTQPTPGGPTGDQTAAAPPATATTSTPDPALSMYGGEISVSGALDTLTATLPEAGVRTTEASVSGLTEWRVVQQPTGTIDTDFDGEPVSVEALNRYASHFTVEFDDPDGTKRSEYPEGQRADLEYSTDGGTTWQTKQSGFAQRNEDGSRVGTTSVLFVGYDHFLRREPVYETFDNATVSSALQTLIEDHSPVTWDATNVEVVNDVLVTREFTGERVDEALEWLAESSGNEEYGVNKDFEFFWRPRDIASAPGDMTADDWIAYDLPRESRHEVNAVRIFFGDGTNTARSSVIAEDRAKQRELKEKLGASRRVVMQTSEHYPEIDNRDAALAKAREILSGRKTVLTGSITTFGKYDWEPGQVFRLTIPERNITSEPFRIAEIRHDGMATTTMKVASATGNVTDLLIGMSDDIDRVDMRGADPDAPYTQSLELEAGFTVDASVEVVQKIDGSTVRSVSGNASAATAMLNQLRDAWAGDGPGSVDTAAVGDGTAPPTVADASLESPVGGEATVSGFNIWSVGETYAVTVEAYIPPATAGGEWDGVEFSELGFFDGDTLVGRGVLNSPVIHTTRTETYMEIRFTFGDDPDATGTVTGFGLLIAPMLWLGWYDSATNAPSIRQYGEPETGVTLQSVETDAEWAEWAAAAEVTNGELYPVRNTWGVEVETSSTGGDYGENYDASQGAHKQLTNDSYDTMDVRVTTTRELQSPDLMLTFRWRLDGEETYPHGSPLWVYIDGQQVESFSDGFSVSSNFGWFKIYTYNLTLPAGSHTIRFLQRSSSKYSYSELSPSQVDYLAILDYSQTNPSQWDNTVGPLIAGAGPSGGYAGFLSDPKPYDPATAITADAPVAPGKKITSVSLTASINDTSADEQLRIIAGPVEDAGDGTYQLVSGEETTYTFDNTATATQSLDYADGVSVGFRLGGFGTRDVGTPTEGFNPQTVDSFELTGDLVLQKETETPTDGEAGETFSEMTLELGEANGTTIDEFAELNAGSDLDLITIPVEPITKTNEFALLTRLAVRFRAV